MSLHYHLAFKVRDLVWFSNEFHEFSMTQKPETRPSKKKLFSPKTCCPWVPCWRRRDPSRREHGSRESVRVQYAEVALLRLDGGLLKFIFPSICAPRERFQSPARP